MKDLRDRLGWQPVGTHKRNTMPFEWVESFPNKMYVHEQTTISSSYVFLILECGAEECVIGTIEEETTLGEIINKKLPILVELNATELLRLFSVTEEEDEHDKKLRESLVLKQPTEADVNTDQKIFFYDLCRFLNENIHNNIYRNSANPPKSNE